jgi:ParB family transcriptional regulator, chromosome partitioning protein
MEIHEQKSVEIELHTLDLRYAHTRIANPRRRDRMTRSIRRFGQLSPVVVIVRNGCLILIDGFLRVASLKALGRDTVIAVIREVDESLALLQLLGTSGQRQWEAVEQAWIIREIRERFDTPLRDIAKGIGRDVSWVSRRLALIDGLTDDLLKSVLGGHVSAWAACRILLPLARANKGHAEKLTEHLAHDPLSTRDLSEFFKHYRHSPKGTRERMIEDPTLFMKAHQQTRQEKSARSLAQGPEGTWAADLNIVKSVLRRVLARLSSVIYDGQDESDRKRLVRAFDDAACLMDEIRQEITKVTGP